MLEKIKQIALRIKALREIAGISVEALAQKLNVSKEQYLRYEDGATDIPVSVLFEVAHEFKVELTSLLTGEEPRLCEYSVVRKGKAPTAERRKEYRYQDLAYNFKHKKGEVFLITVEPRGTGEKQTAYTHPGQEFTYVLEGSLNVKLDSHEVTLNEGDSLYFDSRHPHAMTALNNKPAKFLAVIL